MSKQANPAKIGLFIVLGLALGLAGLLIFTSASLFTHSRHFVLYFNDSVNGLNEGAPVKYRGVTIGSVKRVMIQFNQATNDYAVPVLIEVREDLVRDTMGRETDPFRDASFAGFVRLGMRASLQAESLLTGVLYIEVQPDPNAPVTKPHELKDIYPELPTEPTGIQQLLSNLAALDVKGLVDKLNELIGRLDTTLGSLKMDEIGRSVTNLLVSVNDVVRSPQLTNSLTALAATLQQYQTLGAKLNQRVDPLADSLTNTLNEATRTLVQLRNDAENLRGVLSPDSPERNDLDQALQQLAGAAQAISSLAQFLNQHPNALITGRKTPPPKP